MISEMSAPIAMNGNMMITAISVLTAYTMPHKFNNRPFIRRWGPGSTGFDNFSSKAVFSCCCRNNSSSPEIASVDEARDVDINLLDDDFSANLLMDGTSPVIYK